MHHGITARLPSIIKLFLLFCYAIGLMYWCAYCHTLASVPRMFVIYFNLISIYYNNRIYFIFISMNFMTMESKKSKTLLVHIHVGCAVCVRAAFCCCHGIEYIINFFVLLLFELFFFGKKKCFGCFGCTALIFIATFFFLCVVVQFLKHFCSTNTKHI